MKPELNEHVPASERRMGANLHAAADTLPRNLIMADFPP
jgi:phosphoketolase